MIKVTAVGIAGLPGSGKDTMADQLVANHGFLKVAFADPVYEEVSKAFNVSEERLRQREGKELPQPFLDLDFCNDRTFAALVPLHAVLEDNCLSPRMALRLWATEYRRAADDRYWLKQLDLWVRGSYHDLIVIPDVRFENEAELVRSYSEPRLVHLQRTGVAIDSHRHASDMPVLVHDNDTYLSNDGDLPAFQHKIEHWAALHLP